MGSVFPSDADRPVHARSHPTWRALEGPDCDPRSARTVLTVDGCTARVALGSADDSIEVLAGLQRQRVARGQILAAGVSEAAIKRRVRSGRLVCVHPGVYAIAPLVEIALAAETTALLAAGPDALLSYHSAATLWKLRPGVARPVHVTVPVRRRGPRLDREKIRSHRTRFALQRRLVEGLPVTSPARTLMDQATTELTDRDLERLLDEALFARRLVSEGELRTAILRAGRHQGAAILGRILAAGHADTRTDSDAEEALLELVRQARLPEPVTRASVLDHRLDFLWPDHRLGVEVDGFSYHRSRAAFSRDRRRDADLLTRAGISIVRVPAADVFEDGLAVVALISRALTAAAARHLAE